MNILKQIVNCSNNKIERNYKNHKFWYFLKSIVLLALTFFVSINSCCMDDVVCRIEKRNTFIEENTESILSQYRLLLDNKPVKIDEIKYDEFLKNIFSEDKREKYFKFLKQIININKGFLVFFSVCYLYNSIFFVILCSRASEEKLKE